MIEGVIKKAVEQKISQTLDELRAPLKPQPKVRVPRKPLGKTQSERERVMQESLKYKSLTDWCRKLDHMHTILTCDQSTCKLLAN